jgi:hypothetical protein
LLVREMLEKARPAGRLPALADPAVVDAAAPGAAVVVLATDDERDGCVEEVEGRGWRPAARRVLRSRSLCKKLSGLLKPSRR